MTFKEDFKPSRVYNKLVIDAINKDIANDNCIIIKNKQVYKSELDYLYDDNENNETEIIEAEEVDTGKIDWDW